MTAYVIIRVQVTDMEQYRRYMAVTPAIVAAHRGRFVVRGGPATVLEGPETDDRIVVLGFPSTDDARAFYDSEEYRAAKTLRAGAAEASFVLVEGVD